MRVIARFTQALLASSVIFVSGCATAPDPKPTLPAFIPKLKVTTDCGDCDVRPDVPLRIKHHYELAAKQIGVQVSSTQEVTAVIRSYSERNDTARVWAGALAGKDELKVEVNLGGKVITAEDYFRNAFQGMDELTKRIGQMLVAKMSKELAP